MTIKVLILLALFFSYAFAGSGDKGGNGGC
jgi:hypothetical protein